jgi:hypothetical protein
MTSHFQPIAINFDLKGMWGKLIKTVPAAQPWFPRLPLSKKGNETARGIRESGLELEKSFSRNAKSSKVRIIIVHR